jgi:chaperonin GroEL
MIIFGKEAREKLMKGINLVADTVAPTLGPQARTVILESEKPIIVNDGVTIARHISHPDQFVNMGVKLLQSVASEAQGYAGDGTTTASILARRICEKGLALVEDGYSPVQLKKELEEGVAVILEVLEKMAVPVEDSAMIRNVATISANNDLELGDLICSVMEKVGKDGVITVQEANSIETTFDIVEGIKLDRGYISHLMMNNKETAECIFNNPLVFMCNEDVRNAQDIIPIMEIALSNKRPLLIIAKTFEGTALNSLLFNLMHKTIDCAVIRCPNFGDEAIEEMEDIASVIGGNVINVEIGGDISKAVFEDLGQCDRIVITKGTTTIIGGDANTVEERVSTLNAQYEEAPNDWFKDKLKYRIGKLSGGIGVIKVGGATEVEMKERKERLDDALNATKAAMQEGVVVGGGKALATAVLKVRQTGEFKDMFAHALREPLRVLLANGANENEFNELSFSNTNMGYDALTDSKVNLWDAGIIDPVKVTRASLQAAASIAGMVLTTEVLVGIDNEVLV